MNTKRAMDSRAFDAEHNAKVNGRPLWLLAGAVCTRVVAGRIQEVQTQGVAREGREGREFKF